MFYKNTIKQTIFSQNKKNLRIKNNETIKEVFFYKKRNNKNEFA